MSGNYYGFTPGGTQFGNTYTPRPPAATPAAFPVQYAAGAQPYNAYATPTGPSGPYQTSFTTGVPSRPLDQNAGQSSGYTFPQTNTDSTRPIYSTQSMSTGYAANNSAAATSGASTGTSFTSTAVTTTSSVTTYSGYDAALYAAATNFVASKALGGGGGGGGGGTWMSPKRGGGTGGGFSGGGGRGSFPKKSFNTTPKQQQLLYCEVCKISCAGPQTYREHLEGKNHKKKEAQVNSGVQPIAAKTKTSFRCDLCGVTCTGQDTYNAHVRGAKHQKTLKLHQTLNKPIPSTEPTVIPPSQIYKNNPQLMEPKKVVVVPKVNFVGGQTLVSTGMGDSAMIGPDMPDANNRENADGSFVAGYEKDVPPVGEDYVEVVKSDDGKVTSYFCKLCDCRFNDPSAKEMHLKGRRHRLQFKKKVNPDLEVEMKQNPKFRRQADERMRREIMRMRQQDLWAMRAMYQSQMMASPMMNAPVPLFGRPSSANRHTPRIETLNDRYIMVKHSNIFPTDDEANTIQRLVVYVEKSLKSVSDHFAEQAKKLAGESDANAEPSVEPSSDERLLKGVMRVGDLAKQLLLRGDCRVELVVLCSDVPTNDLLEKVCALLPENLATHSDEKFEIKTVESDASIYVSTTDERKIEIQIIFTSVAVRDDNETSNKTADSDVLDKQKCLDALASLRHAKWFQARCTNLPFCSIILRILKDLRQRLPTWAPLTSWPSELFVEKILCSISIIASPAEALRHVFEGIAAGLLMNGGPGLLDPCEKDVVDALATLKQQEREDVTANAQQMLRQMAYGQIYKVLGMEQFDDVDNGPSGSQRKRPRESNEGVEMTEG